MGDHDSEEIERFRRYLEHHKDLADFRLQEEFFFFATVRGQKLWPSAIIVDFALARAGEPTVLVFFNGFVQEWAIAKDLSGMSSQIHISEKPHHRAIRWLGERLKSDRLKHAGVVEIARSEPLKWDFTSCDIVKNLKYLAELGRRLGIKKVVVASEAGLNLGTLPAIIGDGIRVKVLPHFRSKQEREIAFGVMRQFLVGKTIRVVDDSELMQRIRSVRAFKDGVAFTPGEAHPSIGTLASLCVALRIDDAGQLYFPEDVS